MAYTFSPSLRPDAPRTDSGFSETPRKRSRRAGGPHTPLLQSIDTSPASIEAFARRQELLPARPPALQMRPFVQGGACDDGNIFGIRIPAAATPEVDSSLVDEDGDEEEEWVRSDENHDTTAYACAEPRKTMPAWVRPGAAPVPLGELRLDDPRASLDLGVDSSLADMDVDPLDDDDDDDPQEREWPPSPKKSPVKQQQRRLLFAPAPAPAARPPVMFADFASMAPAAAAEEQDRMPALPQMPAKPAARGRKSLLRRRRTTAALLEDPIASPRRDHGARVGKASPGSRQSSVGSRAEEAAPESSTAAARGPGVEGARRADGSVQGRLWEACGRSVQRWNRGDFGIGNELGIEVATVRW